MDRKYSMLDAHILQAQGFTQAEIGAMIGATDRTVRNYLKRMPGSKRRPRRGSKLDTYKPLIEQVLDENPSYNGKISILKSFIAVVRRRLATQAVLRFDEPGFQVQSVLRRDPARNPLRQHANGLPPRL